MSKFSLVKAIVKLYFFGALAVSFTHIIEASHKLGLLGWQSWTTPFAIDGIAMIGMVMRSEAFSSSTRRLGFRVQITAGVLSLACNVFAGDTCGERIYGVLIVALFVLSEWLSDRIEGREIEQAREDAAKQAAAAEEQAMKRAAAARKAAATRKANKKVSAATTGKRKLSSLPAAA